MRLLLISDVHANWDALLAFQRAEVQPDAVLFAGDAVGYGPDPAECVRWLLAQAHTAIAGPLDRALAEGEGAVPTGVAPDLLDAAVETLALALRRVPPAERARLARWPSAAEAAFGGAHFALRRTPRPDLNPATAPEAALEDLFGDSGAQVMVLGGGHLPAIRQLGQRVVVNPGSLGQPRYGVSDATYAVWDDGHLQIRHLHYHPEPVARRLALARLSPEVVEQLSQILTTGMV